MKTLTNIFVFTLLIALITSCSTSNSVVSNNFLQKRKYKKGFYFSKKRKTKKKSFKLEKENSQNSVKLIKLKVEKKLSIPIKPSVHIVSTKKESKTELKNKVYLKSPTFVDAKNYTEASKNELNIQRVPKFLTFKKSTSLSKIRNTNSTNNYTNKNNFHNYVIILIDIVLIVSILLSIFAPTQAALFILTITSLIETFMFLGVIERPKAETGLIEGIGEILLGIGGVGVSFFDAMFNSL